LVEHAHLPNLSNEPFTRAVTDKVIVNGADNYVDAATNAAGVMFQPAAWTAGFVAFPEGGDRKTKM
jgi:hypothetical protein